jgi:hypothetical protein
MPRFAGVSEHAGRRRPLAQGLTALVVAALTLSAATLAAPPALAAPTCQTHDGDTVRCGTSGAMPVGWTLPPDQRADRNASRPANLNLAEGVALVYLVGGLFVILALMPPFDGWESGDWDPQEGDDEERQARPAVRSRPSRRSE